MSTVFVVSGEFMYYFSKHMKYGIEILIFIVLILQINFDITDIFTVLILPVWVHGIPFHCLLSSFILFFSIVKFSL